MVLIFGSTFYLLKLFLFLDQLFTLKVIIVYGFKNLVNVIIFQKCKIPVSGELILLDFFSLPGIFVFSPGVTGLTPPPPTPSRFQATRFEGFNAGLISPLPCRLWYVLMRAHMRCIPKPGLE